MRVRPDTCAFLLTSVPGFPRQQEYTNMLPRLLAGSPGESPVQEEGNSTPEPNPRGRRHRDVPDSRPIGRRQNTVVIWVSAPPTNSFWLPHDLPGGVPSLLMAFLGESPVSPEPSRGVPSFSRAFLGSPQEWKAAGPSDPSITYKTLPPPAPWALSHCGVQAL